MPPDSQATDGPDAKRQRALPIPWVGAGMKAFSPDSSIVSDVIPSPNFGERNGGRAPDMILLHYTGMPDVQGAVRQLCTAGSEVSAHYIVLEDGRIVQCVPEVNRAWHAGVSSWAGEQDINSCSIGIEIVNRGHLRNTRKNRGGRGHVVNEVEAPLPECTRKQRLLGDDARRSASSVEPKRHELGGRGPGLPAERFAGGPRRKDDEIRCRIERRQGLE